MTGTGRRGARGRQRAHPGSAEPAAARGARRCRCVPEAPHRGRGLIKSASGGVIVRRDTVNYTLVGAVVLAAIVLLLVGLALITGRSGATHRLRRALSQRDRPSLRRAGVLSGLSHRPGRRRSRPSARADGTRYKVELAIRRDWPIPNDSPARLQSTRPSRRRLGRHQRRREQEMLAPGGELKGEEGADIFAAMNELAGADQRADAQPDHAADPHAVAARRFDHRRDRQEHAGDPRADARVARAAEHRVRCAQRRAEAGEPRRRSAKILGEVSKLSDRIAQDARDARSGARRDRRASRRKTGPDLRRSVQDLAQRARGAVERAWT